MRYFITFEGPEGGGKTTQIQLLQQRLAAAGYPVVATREPGGTAIGNAIRTVLLDSTNTGMSARTEALLFNAARAQLVDEVIKPALQAGQIVLCDRYADSSVAYQGYGRQLDQRALRALIAFATESLQPDLTIFLNIDPAVGLARKRALTGEEWNRLEEEALSFHHQVRAGFLTLAAAEPHRWLVVDGAHAVEVVQLQIWRRVAALLGAT